MSAIFRFIKITNIYQKWNTNQYLPVVLNIDFMKLHEPFDIIINYHAL